MFKYVFHTMLNYILNTIITIINKQILNNRVELWIPTINNQSSTENEEYITLHLNISVLFMKYIYIYI